MRLKHVLWAALVAGLAVRMIILWQTADSGLHIADERQYAELAGSLLRGQGFAWASGEPTSLRPPLYPAFLASLWNVTGEGNLRIVRFAQILIALLTSWLTYEVGRRTFDRRVGAIAAAVVWWYPPLAYLNFTILTETLFTCLLTAFVLLAVILVQSCRVRVALACGLALGLGALTRSVLWPVPLLLCPLLLVVLSRPIRRRVLLSALVFAGYALVVAPWAVRNTRLQGVPTIVDTMGGMNLRMGNYEYTPEDRMWDAVSMSGEKSWVYALTQEGDPDRPGAGRYTEGYKDKWAQRKAIEYILAHPSTTLRRSVIKFTDLWGVERSYPAAIQQGVYKLPGWLGMSLSLLMVVTSAVLLLAAAAGVWIARLDWRLHAMLLLPIVVVTGIHSIVFGHSRYHLPLVPILAVFAAALLGGGPGVTRTGRGAKVGASALMLVLVAGWIRQILVLDVDRLRAFVDRLW